jgi:hypothetical protein
MAYPCYSSEEIGERGQALSDEQIREKVEPQHNGDFLVLEIETGEYEVDMDSRAAFDRADAKRPGAPFYILRIGYPTAVKLVLQRRFGLRRLVAAHDSAAVN